MPPIKSLTQHQRIGKATLVPGSRFPDDLDTTSLALTVLQPKDPEIIASMLDKMAEYVNPDGTILVSHHRQTGEPLAQRSTDLL